MLGFVAEIGFAAVRGHYEPVRFGVARDTLGGGTSLKIDAY